MRKLRIIIAEDEPIILEMYKNIVGKREDYEIIGTATNGKEEEELIYTIKPDVVITDNQMPIQNGIDVIEKVYNSDLVYKPKFILITGDYRDRSFLDKCEKLQVERVMGKPVNYDSLDFLLTDLKVIIEDETPSFVGKNSEGWREMYMNKEIVDLKKYFTNEEFDLFRKLGIEIKDKIYTEYEIELINNSLYDYYYSEDMSEDEKNQVKSLEETGVTREQYNNLLNKIEQINEEYEF